MVMPKKYIVDAGRAHVVGYVEQMRLSLDDLSEEDVAELAKEFNANFEKEAEREDESEWPST